MYRYTHPLRQDDSILVEDIESAADILANDLCVKLKGPFNSWLNKLEGLRDQNELPKKTARLGDTPFTSMGITRNDKRFAHKDDDALLGFIIWFTKGMYIFFKS